MLRKTLITTAVIALTTSLAFAAENTTKNTASHMAMTGTSANYLTSIDSKYWLGSKVIGMPVYTAASNERIGEVNNIVITPTGEVTALIVGAGGFLGVGERNIAVRFQAFKPVMKDGDSKLTLDVTKEQLKEVAEIKLPSNPTY